MFAERGYDGADPGPALIRDGNGTRSIETLLRRRGAAMAEFMRALGTLKTLQAERAAVTREVPPRRPAAGVAHRPEPNEPERGAALRLDYVMPDLPAPGPRLHRPAAPWPPNEPETGLQRAQPTCGPRLPNEPEATRNRSEMGGEPAGDRASAA